jgi:hypothetical protein
MRAVVPITVAPRAIGIVRVAVIAEAGTPAAGGTKAAAERPASPHAAAVIVDPGGEVGFADRAADADAQSMACARCGMSDPAATMAIAAAIVTRILRILISFIRFQFARNSGEPIMKVIVAQRR